VDGVALAFTIAVMRFSLRLLPICFLILPPASVMAQTSGLANPPMSGKDSVYEVPASDLKKLDSSAAVEFPRELSAYEISETVAIEVTVSAEGKVRKAKAVSGKLEALKDAAEKTVKKWEFEPYLVNGTPVPVRTEITLNFNNTLDHYRDPNGDAQVHLDEKSAKGLIAKNVPPQYPPDARVAHIQGVVELRVIVGEDGRVHALHIIKGHPMLATAAYNAVRQWEFKPYVENGKTLPVDTKETVTFSIR
jgi:TonB family protein